MAPALLHGSGQKWASAESAPRDQSARVDVWPSVSVLAATPVLVLCFALAALLSSPPSRAQLTPITLSSGARAAGGNGGVEAAAGRGRGGRLRGGALRRDGPHRGGQPRVEPQHQLHPLVTQPDLLRRRPHLVQVPEGDAQRVRGERDGVPQLHHGRGGRELDLRQGLHPAQGAPPLLLHLRQRPLPGRHEGRRHRPPGSVRGHADGAALLRLHCFCFCRRRRPHGLLLRRRRLADGRGARGCRCVRRLVIRRSLLLSVA